MCFHGPKLNGRKLSGYQTLRRPDVLVQTALCDQPCSRYSKRFFAKLERRSLNATPCASHNWASDSPCARRGAAPPRVPSRRPAQPSRTLRGGRRLPRGP